MTTPQRRTYYGARWYIAWQLERERRRLAGQGYTIASETWIPGVWFMPAVTMCLIVTYHHRDDPTAPPASELQRLIELGQVCIITRRQVDRAMHRLRRTTLPLNQAASASPTRVTLSCWCVQRCIARMTRACTGPS